MRLTLCTLFNMNYHFLNTYYYCVHFSNYIVLFLSLLHKDAHVHIRNSISTHTHLLGHMGAGTRTHTHTAESLCDGCILMRSNKDGNDPVHFSLSHSLSLLCSLSLSLSPTAWHTAVSVHEASVNSKRHLIWRGGGVCVGGLNVLAFRRFCTNLLVKKTLSSKWKITSREMCCSSNFH